MRLTRLAFFAILTIIIELPKKYAICELIETCPWETYWVTGSKEGWFQTEKCQRICVGKAFHDSKGELICFQEREVSQFKHIKLKDNPISYLCECGYYSSRTRGKWLSCDFNIFNITRGECVEICNEAYVYLFTRKNKKSITHCEKTLRNKFYNIVGEIAHLRGHTPSQKTFTRECICGINNTDLVVLESKTDSFAAIEYEKCADIWKTAKIANIRTVETCLLYCRDVCKKGRGFFHEDKPLCYHYGVPTARHTITYGGSKDKCVCGHTKRISFRARNTNRPVFVGCEPQITSNITQVHECRQFCAESMAYVYHNVKNPLSIRCIYKPDRNTIKPQPLLEKCSNKTYERNNGKDIYMKCRCVLNKSTKSKSPKIVSKENEGEIRLPDAWSVKRKRSLRRYSNIKKCNLVETFKI